MIHQGLRIKKEEEEAAAAAAEESAKAAAAAAKAAAKPTGMEVDQFMAELLRPSEMPEEKKVDPNAKLLELIQQMQQKQMQQDQQHLQLQQQIANQSNELLKYKEKEAKLQEAGAAPSGSTATGLMGDLQL